MGCPMWSTQCGMSRFERHNLLHPPKRPNCRKLQATFIIQTFQSIPTTKSSTRQQTPNAWEDRTQTSINTTDATLLDTPTTMNIQQIQNDVNASKERSACSSVEAIVSVQGAATSLITVMDCINIFEATLTQVSNKCLRNYTNIITVQQNIFSTTTQKLNISTAPGPVTVSTHQ